MATLYSPEYNQNEPDLILKGGGHGTKVRCLRATYTYSAAGAIGDVIYMGRLPKGAKVVGLMLYSPGAATQTIDLGTATDPDAFVDAVVHAADGFLVDTDLDPATAFAALTDDDDVILTNGVVAYEDTDVITMALFYVFE